MENSSKKIILSNKLKKHFSQCDASTGYVAGWETKSEIHCMTISGCSDLLISGLEVIGFFCLVGERTEKNDLLDLCENTLSTLEIDVENPVVLFVKKSKDEVHVFAKLLTPYEGTLTNFELKETDQNAGILVRAKGQIPVIVEVASEPETYKENVELVLERVRTLCQSKALAFLLNNCTYILHSSEESRKCTIKDLLKIVAENAPNENVKGKKGTKIKNPVNFDILLQTSGDAALENTFNHSVVIHCQRREFRCASLNIPLDVVALCHESSSTHKIYRLLQDAIDQQLIQISQCLHNCARSLEITTPVPYHFYPDLWEFPGSIVYPLNKTDAELEESRQELHKQLLLPLDRPFLKKLNSWNFSTSSPSGYLFNPHEGINFSPADGNSYAVVQGRYTYHHYMQDHANDNGWGCAYRSLQTIISWFKYQGYTDKEIPSHTEIQQALVDVGDKPQNFVGSKKWIGSQEVSFCLDHLIQVQSKIMFVSSGAEMSSKGRELYYHFKIQGTPVMIGGGVLAHTILGVDFNQDTGDLKFLILDPHYTGGEDLQVILNKGWCGWKGTQFWDQTAFYNLCLPQRPIMI